MWSGVCWLCSSGTWNGRRRRRRDRVNIKLSVHREIIQIIMILDIYFHICLHRDTERDEMLKSFNIDFELRPIVVMGFFNAKDSLFFRLFSLLPASQ